MYIESSLLHNMYHHDGVVIKEESHIQGRKLHIQQQQAKGKANQNKEVLSLYKYMISYRDINLVT